MKTIIDEVKRLNNDINNIITELVKARLAHNDAAVANIHHKMESLMVETQQVCSFIIDNLPNENLDEAADCYLENIQPVGFMEGDYDGSQMKWNKQSEKDILESFDDWKFHQFICLMRNGGMCVWNGINDEHDDGMIEKHLTPKNPKYNIEDIVYWSEITN